MRLTSVGIWLLPLALVGSCEPAARKSAASSNAIVGSAVRLIVKLRDPQQATPTFTRLQQQAQRRGLRFGGIRQSNEHVYIYEISGVGDDRALRDYLAAVATDPNIDYVEPDRILRHQKPNNEANR